MFNRLMMGWIVIAALAVAQLGWTSDAIRPGDLGVTAQNSTPPVAGSCNYGAEFEPNG